MKDVVGSPGTRGGLALRVAQCAFSGACLAMAANDGLAAGSMMKTFWTVLMGTLLLYGFILAFYDAYALAKNKDLHTFLFIRKILVADWVMAVLCFAAATSATGMYAFVAHDVHLCHITHKQVPCKDYLVSLLFGFMAWSSIAASALSVLWVFAALPEVE